MTPQTLINDLTTENCDPRDIILMVIGWYHSQICVTYVAEYRMV